MPFTRSGEELSTSGVPGGRALEVEGWDGVTPGGSEGGSTNGEPLPVAAVALAAAGTAVAAVAPGQALVRNDPRASEVIPFRQRVSTRKR